MSLSTYAELKNAISDWLIHEDASNNAATFIRLCEADLRRRLRLRKMQERQRMTMTANQDFYPLPDDFLRVVRFRLFDVNNGSIKTRKIRYLSPQAIEGKYYESYKDQQNLVGVPEHFTIIGNQLQLIPIPDQAYVSNMTFYKRIPYLSDANDTNLFLEDYPDILLYGSLMHGAPFIKEDQRAVNFSLYYEQQIQEANEVDAMDILGDEGPDMEVESLGIQDTHLFDTTSGIS